MGGDCRFSGALVGLMLAVSGCAGHSVTKPDEETAGAPSNTGGGSASAVPEPTVGASESCQAPLIHVAFGSDEGNTDYDFTSGCTADESAQVIPVGYRVGEHLVISACAQPGPNSPSLRVELSAVTGPGQYSTNKVAFVDHKLRPWLYEGSIPSTDLGWTTTVESLGPVGSSVSGTYIGMLRTDTAEIHLMGYFGVCRVEDQPAP